MHMHLRTHILCDMHVYVVHTYIEQEIHEGNRFIMLVKFVRTLSQIQSSIAWYVCIAIFVIRWSASIVFFFLSDRIILMTVRQKYRFPKLPAINYALRLRLDAPSARRWDSNFILWSHKSSIWNVRTPRILFSGNYKGFEEEIVGEAGTDRS